MKLHNSIALAAVAAVLAVPTMAEAKVKHHHVKAKKVAAAKAEAGLTSAEQLQLAQQQLAQMQAQLNDLQAKVSAPAPKDVATAEAAKAASTKADKALATAEKAQAAVTKTDKAVAAVKWASDTTVSGRIYLNASNITQHTNGANNANTGTGVNLKRIYLGVDHKFNKVFAANVTMDVANVFGQTNAQNVATTNATTTAPVCTTVANATTPVTYTTTCAAPTTSIGNTALVGKGFYVKKAYGEAKLDPAFIVRVGSADMPWVPYSEGNMGFRHVENPFIDRISYGTSADWGVHVLGDLVSGKDGGISYQISAVNGAGYRNVKITKSVDFEGRLSGTYKGLYAGVGGYVGKRGNNVEQLAATGSTFRTAKRFDAAAGYKNAMFGIGAEYFYAKDWNNVTVNPATNLVSEDSAEGWSVYGNFNLSKKWTVFSRYDAVKPSKMAVSNLRDNYFNVGLQYSPAKIVDIALVYKRETVNGGAFGTVNGTIGCATSATANAFSTPAAAAATCAGNGTYDEIGIFGNLRF